MEGKTVVRYIWEWWVQNRDWLDIFSSQVEKKEAQYEKAEKVKLICTWVIMANATIVYEACKIFPVLTTVIYLLEILRN